MLDYINETIVGYWELVKVKGDCSPDYSQSFCSSPTPDSYRFLSNGTFKKNEYSSSSMCPADSGVWAVWLFRKDGIPRIDILKPSYTDTLTNSVVYSSGGCQLRTLNKNRLAMSQRCSWMDGAFINVYIYKRRKSEI